MPGFTACPWILEQDFWTQSKLLSYMHNHDFSFLLWPSKVIVRWSKRPLSQFKIYMSKPMNGAKATGSDLPGERLHCSQTKSMKWSGSMEHWWVAFGAFCPGRRSFSSKTCDKEMRKDQLRNWSDWKESAKLPKVCSAMMTWTCKTCFLLHGARVLLGFRLL